MAVPLATNEGKKKDRYSISKKCEEAKEDTPTYKTVTPKMGVTSFLATVVCQTDRRCNRHNKIITLRLALLFVSECLTPLRVWYMI